MGATKTDQYSLEIKRIAKLNRVLSHPARLTIIDALRTQPGLRPVDIQQIIGLGQPGTQRHILLLKETGVVRYHYETHHYRLFLHENILNQALSFLLNEHLKQ